MATQKLNVKDTIIAGAQYGMKNILNLILMVVLYVLTAWIPYFNIGTTVGLYKAIIKIGRGEMIKPTDIWAKGNWDNLGDLFLLLGLMSMGISAAALFMFIPALVVGIAWGFAVFFFIDRGVSPTKALKLSWKATDGEKWKIFFVYLVLYIAVGIVCGVLGLIPKVGAILSVIAVICCCAIVVAVEGVLFKHFSDKADEMAVECCCKAPEAPKAPAAPAAEAPKAPEAPAEEEAPKAE